MIAKGGNMKKRMNISLLVIISIFLYVSFAWSDGRPQALWGSGGLPIEKQISAEFMPGEVLIKFNERATQAEMKSLHSNLRAQEIRRIEPLE